MRGFEHAAACRDEAESIVVRLELANGAVGWGQTLPRSYVTGENLESVCRDLTEELWSRYCAEPSQPLPERVGDRIVNAAACALELASQDAAGTLTRCVRPGESISTRVSGVLGCADPARTTVQLRRMLWFGLKDFKLKLGFGEDIDAENLRLVHRKIGKALARGKKTLRVDINGGWERDATPQRIARLKAYGICAVEQPVFCPPEQLVDLAHRCALPLLADESLLTFADAEILLSAPRKIGWNIRLCKNGGIGRCKALANLANDNGVMTTVGCMVGESSILSAAQRRLLQCIAAPRFVEGNYGTFLLREDLSRKSLRFGYGGRLKLLQAEGLGACVDRKKLARYGQRIATLTNPKR